MFFRRCFLQHQLFGGGSSNTEFSPHSLSVIKSPMVCGESIAAFRQEGAVERNLQFGNSWEYVNQVQNDPT